MVHDVFHLIIKFVQYVLDIVRARLDHSSYIAYDRGRSRAFTDKVILATTIVAASHVPKTVLSVYNIFKSSGRPREIGTTV